MLAMTRRDAIERLTLLMGGAIVGAEVFLNGTIVEGKPAPASFTPQDTALLDEIGETIIPTTTTPGAKAAQIGAFMQMMVNDCYDEQNQAIFQAGLGQVEASAQKQYGKKFMDLSARERTTLLQGIDKEERQYRAQKAASDPVHYFRLMKQLTLLGYFTSEIGCTQALRFTEVPGGFRGNEPYKKGDRAWFVPPGHFI